MSLMKSTLASSLASFMGSDTGGVMAVMHVDE